MNPIVTNHKPYVRRFKLSDNATELELIVQPTHTGKAYFWEHEGKHVQVAYVTTEGRLWLYAKGVPSVGRGPIAPRLAIYIAQARQLFNDEELHGVYDTRMDTYVPICTLDEALEQLEAQATTLIEACMPSMEFDEMFGSPTQHILHMFNDLIRHQHAGRCPLHADNCLSAPTTWDEQQIVEHVVKGNVVNTAGSFDCQEYRQLVDKVNEIVDRVRSELGV